MVTRLGFLIAALWLTELILTALFPFLRLLADFLFLFLIFLGFQWPSPRFLWLAGIGLGILRDLSVGGIFGGWAFVFGLCGWILARLRYLVAAEDPLIVGIFTGLMTVLAGFFYACFVIWTDPSISWRHGSWGALPVQAVLHAMFAIWIFPQFRRYLSRGRRRSVLP